MTFVSGDILYQSIAKIAATYNAMGALSIASYDINNKLDDDDTASICDNANLSAARGATIFDRSDLTADKVASIFNETALSITKINDIIIHANITDDKAQQILSEITKVDRDLTSATNIYEIIDDWNDNKLTARDGAGVTPTGFTNLFAQKNKFRPEWTKTESVGDSIIVTGGEIKFVGANTSADDRIVAASTFNIGEWEFKQRLNELSGLGQSAYFCPFFTDTSNYYAYCIDNDADNLLFEKRVAGAFTNLLTPAFTRDTSTHTLKITRGDSDNFEIFEGGISKGTVSDSAFTTTTNIAFSNQDTTIDIFFDDLKVH